MEKPKLEKIIERLEKIDAEAWERYDNITFTARVSGLTVHLQVWKDFGKTQGYINITSDDKTRQIDYHAQSKIEEDAIKNLYENVCKKYDQVKDKEFKERLNNFLSD